MKSNKIQILKKKRKQEKWRQCFTDLAPDGVVSFVEKATTLSKMEKAENKKEYLKKYLSGNDKKKKKKKIVSSSSSITK